MAAESLRDELMALPGVADAEVDESEEAPSGVRVRLEPDADARAVGAEVQRVLADHGMRSRITAGAGGEPLEAEAVPPPLVPPPPTEPPPVPSVAEPEVPAQPEEPARPGAPDAVVPPVAVAAPYQPRPGAAEPRLASVTMTESGEAVEVVATGSDGGTVSRSAPATLEAMAEAAVDAVGTLAEGETLGIVKIDMSEADGSQVVTVVVERVDGSRAAGAALVRVGHAYAVARAAWAALHDG